MIDLSYLPEGGRILEVGCGTGQATLPFAASGHTILCLEPGPNLAAAATERLRLLPNAVVEAVTFEEWPLEEAAFDLVVSAQAFHWIDPEVGYQKAAQALKPAGSLALFWKLPPDEPTPHHEETELTELSEAIQSQYALHAPELAHVRLVNPLATQVATLERDLRTRVDLFPDVRVLCFPWSEQYDAARYVALLSTYSGHIALPHVRRQALFDGIARAIDEEAGGVLIKRYVSVLLLARVAAKG